MVVIICVIFLLTLFLSLVPPKSEKVKIGMYYFIGALMIIAAGTRGPGVDRDYVEYVSAFYNAGFGVTIEVTFVLISEFVKATFHNEIGLFLIYALIGVSIKLKAIKQLTPLLFPSLLVYISNYYILHELTQIRAGVAAALLLLAIKPLYERNGKSFFLIAFTALLFHYSAVIVFFLWFINPKTPSKIIMFAVPLSGFAFYILNINPIYEIPIPYMQRKLALYQELQEYGEGFDKINVLNVFFVTKTIVYFLLALLSKSLVKSNKYTYLLLKINAFSLFALPAFAIMPALAFRVYELLGVVDIILIPFLFYVFYRKYSGIFATIFISALFVFVYLFHNKIIT